MTEQCRSKATPPAPTAPAETEDTNVAAVRAKLLKRSQVGLAKYGVTTERGDLTMADWMLHLQEELMDAVVYIEAALKRAEAAERRVAELLELLDWMQRTGGLGIETHERISKALAGATP